MNEKIRQVLIYVNNELQQVYVHGHMNIMHMDAAMSNINMLLDEPITPPEEAKIDGESEEEQKPDK